MTPGISVTLSRFDDGLATLFVAASNGGFEASVEMLDGAGFATILANAIRGFPNSGNDVRTVALGSSDPHSYQGGIRLVLRCEDRAGHALIDVEIRSGAQRPQGTASFLIPVEPVAIDAFVVQLERLPLQDGANATLVAA